MSWRRVARVPGDPSHPLPVSGDPLAVSDDVLASALDDLDAGFTPVEILDRYPEYASELAPLLQTAYELRMTRWPVMSVGGRVAGRERMHAALSAQKRRKAGFLPPFWRQVGVTAALMVMAGAVFLASPLSPLDFPRRGRAVTPTMSAPAVAAPTSTLTAVAPTTSPAVTQPATEMPARVPAVITDEPSETPERLVLAEERASATPTPAPTATPMRRATRTRTATPAPTATVSATAVTATPTAQSGGSSATAQPSPSPTRVIVISTPAPTHTPPAKPSPTVTVRPTEPPEPTATLTLPPPTRTPQPSLTPAPTASRTPEPTETSELPEATRTPKHTPRPSATPGPSRTPRVGAALPGAPQIRSALEGRPVQTMQQEMRTVIRAIRSPVPRAGRP